MPGAGTSKGTASPTPPGLDHGGVPRRQPAGRVAQEHARLGAPEALGGGREGAERPRVGRRARPGAVLHHLFHGVQLRGLRGGRLGRRAPRHRELEGGRLRAPARAAPAREPVARGDQGHGLLLGEHHVARGVPPLDHEDRVAQVGRIAGVLQDGRVQVVRRAGGGAARAAPARLHHRGASDCALRCGALGRAGGRPRGPPVLRGGRRASREAQGEGRRGEPGEGSFAHCDRPSFPKARRDPFPDPV